MESSESYSDDGLCDDRILEDTINGLMEKLHLEDKDDDDDHVYSATFSIRQYVSSVREKDIMKCWPFSQKYLKKCMENGRQPSLPPIEFSQQYSEMKDPVLLLKRLKTDDCQSKKPFSRQTDHMQYHFAPEKQCNKEAEMPINMHTTTEVDSHKKLRIDIPEQFETGLILFKEGVSRIPKARQWRKKLLSETVDQRPLILTETERGKSKVTSMHAQLKGLNKARTLIPKQYKDIFHTRNRFPDIMKGGVKGNKKQAKCQRRNVKWEELQGINDNEGSAFTEPVGEKAINSKAQFVARSSSFSKTGKFNPQINKEYCKVSDIEKENYTRSIRKSLTLKNWGTVSYRDGRMQQFSRDFRYEERDEEFKNSELLQEATITKVCPVCLLFSSTSNTALNAHIDHCLSNGTEPKNGINRTVSTRVRSRKRRSIADIFAVAPTCMLEGTDEYSASEDYFQSEDNVSSEDVNDSGIEMKRKHFISEFRKFPKGNSSIYSKVINDWNVHPKHIKSRMQSQSAENEKKFPPKKRRRPHNYKFSGHENLVLAICARDKPLNSSEKGETAVEPHRIKRGRGRPSHKSISQQALNFQNIANQEPVIPYKRLVKRRSRRTMEKANKLVKSSCDQEEGLLQKTISMQENSQAKLSVHEGSKVEIPKFITVLSNANSSGTVSMIEKLSQDNMPRKSDCHLEKTSDSSMVEANCISGLTSLEKQSPVTMGWSDTPRNPESENMTFNVSEKPEANVSERINSIVHTIRHVEEGSLNLGNASHASIEVPAKVVEQGSEKAVQSQTAVTEIAEAGMSSGNGSFMSLLQEAPSLTSIKEIHKNNNSGDLFSNVPNVSSDLKCSNNMAAINFIHILDDEDTGNGIGFTKEKGNGNLNMGQPNPTSKVVDQQYLSAENLLFHNQGNYGEGLRGSLLSSAGQSHPFHTQFNISSNGGTFVPPSRFFNESSISQRRFAAMSTSDSIRVTPMSNRSCPDGMKLPENHCPNQTGTRIIYPTIDTLVNFLGRISDQTVASSSNFSVQQPAGWQGLSEPYKFHFVDNQELLFESLKLASVQAPQVVSPAFASGQFGNRIQDPMINHSFFQQQHCGPHNLPFGEAHRGPSAVNNFATVNSLHNSNPDALGQAFFGRSSINISSATPSFYPSVSTDGFSSMHTGDINGRPLSFLESIASSTHKQSDFPENPTVRLMGKNLLVPTKDGAQDKQPYRSSISMEEHSNIKYLKLLGFLSDDNRLQDRVIKQNQAHRNSLDIHWNKNSPQENGVYDSRCSLSNSTGISNLPTAAANPTDGLSTAKERSKLTSNMNVPENKNHLSFLSRQCLEAQKWSGKPSSMPVSSTEVIVIDDDSPDDNPNMSMNCSIPFPKGYLADVVSKDTSSKAINPSHLAMPSKESNMVWSPIPHPNLSSVIPELNPDSIAKTGMISDVILIN